MDVGDRAAQTTGSSFNQRIGRTISLDHAAELLRVSRRTVYNRIRQGRLRTIRVRGRSQRVLLDSVALMLLDIRAAAADKKGAPPAPRFDAVRIP